MAVILRETREVDGKSVVVKVYKTDRLLTKEAKRQAEKLDVLLSDRLEDIETAMKKEGLLELKGRPGVVRLWYEVGKRLSFAMDPKIVPLEDQKYIWRAIYDHARGLIPGPGKSRAEQYGRNHFRYCALLAKFDWTFVESAGDWRSWVEFFDSEAIRAEPRIVEWLQKRSADRSTEQWKSFAAGGRKRMFRELIKAIRREFRKTDASYLSESELFAKLDRTFEETNLAVNA